MVVLARSTQEGVVVNLPSLRAVVPELDRLIAEAGEGGVLRREAQRLGRRGREELDHRHRAELRVDALDLALELGLGVAEAGRAGSSRRR